MTLYTGPMFSGKSTKMLTHLEQLDKSGFSYKVLKPKIDTRKNDRIILHSGKEIKATTIAQNEIILPHIVGVDFLAVDEIQFFSSEQILSLIEFRDLGICNIIANGLDRDASGNHFKLIGNKLKHMGEVIDASDEVVYLHSVCGCGQIAKYTQKKIMNDKLHEIGGQDLYLAKCEDCFEVKK